ncbi:MAG: PQQ-binding-like beta-propeller repeat protein [Bacteroidales bacterium]|nr:PQQ-binding-like beta-propeller repeat protein [Bacteroidales bacterium]MBK8884277.1 PQQ-binding-like beta-propeller repeat protein [Bacteroidales bacterium]
MEKRNIITIGLFAAGFAILLGWYLLKDQPLNVYERIPGMDNRPKMEPRSDSVIIGENFDTLGIFDEMIPGDWPRFRGTDFDNINKDTTPLLEKWDTSGPQIVWRTTLGEGYAGPVVHNGRVYLLDYNERKKADVLRCFSLASGRELWRRWYYVELKRNHGYSRTIPAVTDKYILTIGPRSHVMCLEPLSGNLLWTIDLEKEYGIPGKEKGRITPDFYSGQCPIIDNDAAIIAPGGKALMIGVSCSTGKVLWKTPNPDTLRMSHGSIIPMVIHGKRMYVYNAVGGVCGVSAEGSDIGKLMWQTTEWSPATTAASPIFLGNNEIAVFGSYGAGGARIKINYNGSEYSAAIVEQHKATNGIASDQQTPILTGDYIWCLMPENSGQLKKQLVCYHKSDLLKPVWSSGKENRYGRGLGPYLISGDKMYLLDDDAMLYLFRIQDKSITLLDSHKIINGIEAWAPMAIAGHYLIIRDARNLLCLDI